MLLLIALACTPGTVELDKAGDDTAVSDDTGDDSADTSAGADWDGTWEGSIVMSDGDDTFCEGDVELETDDGALTGDGVCTGENPDGGEVAFQLEFGGEVDDGVISGDITIQPPDDAPGDAEPIEGEFSGQIEADVLSLDWTQPFPLPPDDPNGGELELDARVTADRD